jgi:hypothetical protein
MDFDFSALSDRITTAAMRPYSFPHEVVEDQSLNMSEKRAILSEWASDACAVESFPTLRLLPGTSFPVTYSAIMDAREQLERRAMPDEQYGDDSLGTVGEVIVADFSRRKFARAIKPRRLSKNCAPPGHSRHE